MKNRSFLLRLGIVWSLLVTLPSVGWSQDPFSLPRLMDQHPKFERVEAKSSLSERLIPLWIEALQSKNVNLQRKAAESISIAKANDLGPLDFASPELLKKIGQENIDPIVRVAVAKAIVSLELASAAPKFLELAKANQNPQLNSVIQPALAKWKIEEAGSFWRKVLEDDSNGIRERVLAIDGLASLGDKSVADLLKKRVADEAIDYRVRLASAIYLDQTSAGELVAIADKLSKSTKVRDRILAAKLIKKSTESGALELSLQLAKDTDSAVCAIAWSGIVASANARKLDQHLEFGVGHREPKVRHEATDLLSLWGNEEACAKLGMMLSDLHPKVRNNARKILLEFSKTKALKAAVIKAAVDRLDSNWQGMQQALLILTELDHKDSAIRFVKLLSHRRAEVHITAGWALEQLSVADTLKPAFQFAEEKVRRIKSGEAYKFDESEYESLSHVIQLLGKNKYKEMEKEIIPRLIPKDMNILAYPIRPAAIWSIGKIYEGQELPQNYQQKLLERLMDDNPNDPEHTYVKSMCAFTFAITNQEDKIPNIEKYADSTGDNSRFGFYCNWALNQLDGRPIPKVAPFIKNDTDWFLNPIE